MSRRLVTFLPTIFAALIALWAGIDWLFLRDLTGAFTYYGAIPSHLIDGVMGSLLLVGSASMVWGVLCGREFFTRIGYAFAGFSYLLFAAGLLMSPLIPDSEAGLQSNFSSMTPGWNYLLLGAWLLLTAATEWGNDLDPHA